MEGVDGSSPSASTIRETKSKYRHLVVPAAQVAQEQLNEYNQGEKSLEIEDPQYDEYPQIN